MPAQRSGAGLTTLFISDLHLEDERPQTTALFLEFLQQEATGADRLYILGDLFEYWIGDDFLTATANSVAEGLAQLAAGGTTDIYFMRGNRDFLLGNAYAASCSMRILEDPAVILLDGQPTILSHGDQVCVDDVEYQRFRSQVRDPHWQREFLALSIDERLAFAAQAREGSRDHTRTAPSEIMDVNQRAVAELAQRLDSRLLIHGHTHRPAIHRSEQLTRIVLGDWYEQGSVLVAQDGELDLRGL